MSAFKVGSLFALMALFLVVACTQPTPRPTATPQPISQELAIAMASADFLMPSEVVDRADVSFGVEGLTYRVETSVVDIAPSKLQVIVTMTNTSNKLVQIEWGACAVWLRAYSTPDRSGVPAWDERQRPNPDPKTGAYWGCPLYQVVTELDSGESITSKEFHRSVPIPDIMGDSVPDGRYYFTARIELNDTATELAVGDVLLVKAQDPLPAERTVEGLSYRAMIERVSTSPVTLRTTVTVTNTSNERVATTITRDCPVNLFVYQDAASRDAVPLREPVWRTTSMCHLHMLDFSLSPGESRQFGAGVNAPEILSNSLPDGRYYFTVVVWTQGRRIVLAAGDVELYLSPDSREKDIPPTSTSSPTPTPSPRPWLSCSGREEEPPCARGVEIGNPYPYTLYTHCGIRSAYFDGRWWIADPILSDISNVNPPPGWDNPRARGKMELVAEDLARFTSSAGLVAGFRPLPEGPHYPWRSCD